MSRAVCYTERKKGQIQTLDIMEWKNAWYPANWSTDKRIYRISREKKKLYKNSSFDQIMTFHCSYISYIINADIIANICVAVFQSRRVCMQSPKKCEFQCERVVATRFHRLISKSSAFVILCLKFHLKNRYNEITRVWKNMGFLVSIRIEINSSHIDTSAYTIYQPKCCDVIIFARVFCERQCAVYMLCVVYKKWFVFVMSWDINNKATFKWAFCGIISWNFQPKMDSASEWLLNGFVVFRLKYRSRYKRWPIPYVCICVSMDQESINNMNMIERSIAAWQNIGNFNQISIVMSRKIDAKEYVIRVSM